jgi:hypothetical protein
VRRLYQTGFSKSRSRKTEALASWRACEGSDETQIVVSAVHSIPAAAQGDDRQWQRTMHEDFENFARRDKCIDDNAWEMDWRDKVSDAATIVLS